MTDAQDDTPLRSVPIEITISVGKARPLVRDLLKLGQDAILPLDRTIRFGPVGVIWAKDNTAEAVRLFVEHIAAVVGKAG